MKFNQPFLAKYKIKKIFSEKLFTVRILDTDDFKCEVEETRFYGDFVRVYEGDVFSSECMFVKDQKGDYLLKMTGLPICEIPSTQSELAKFAASQIKGVSENTMVKIVKALGDDFIELVNKNENILDEFKLTSKQKENITNWCSSHENLFSSIGDLYLKGVSPFEVIEVYKKYNSKTLQMFNTNPYLIYLTGLVSFKKIDKIALIQGKDLKCVDRIASLIFEIINDEQNKGSMAVKKDKISYLMSKREETFTYEEVCLGINFLLDNGFVEEARFKENVYYGKSNNLKAERYIADYINEIKNKNVYTTEQIDNGFKGNELNKEQREAVYMCLQKRFSILSGGPGTGKTFTIKRIIRTAKCINPTIRISLMAPTGKAASRMIEMIGMESSTIHAAFGLSEDDNLIEKDGMHLEKDLIIIDEASMIDEQLFSYFCRHIPKTCQVILVGDTGQLPSVEAGNLLTELSELVSKYELTTICRQDKKSAIVLNAHKIRNKEFTDIEFNDETFNFIECENIVDTVKDLYEKYCKMFEPKDVMVLSPQHERSGTIQINAAIQECNKEPIIKTYYRKNFKKGDRVIQTKNNKNLNIHNGDLGEVISETEKGLNVWFDDKEDPIEVKEMNDIELAYAITVHKSQGSEADVVIMVFNKGHTYTLSNKLIYTALTRTKKIFIGVGNKEAFNNGIQKEENSRISLIKQYVELYNNLALK